MSDPVIDRSAAIAALRDALGDDVVYTDAQVLAPHLVEWRKLYSGSADVLIRPRHVEHVATTLAIASRFDMPVTPQGGRTGLVGGGVPQGGLVLSLTG